MSVQFRAKKAVAHRAAMPPLPLQSWNKAPPVEQITIMKNDDDSSVFSQLSNVSESYGKRMEAVAHQQNTTVAHQQNTTAFGNARSKENKLPSLISVRPIYYGNHWLHAESKNFIVMTVPASLGRRNLTTAWWEHCPFHCQAHEKATTKASDEPYGCRYYCHKLNDNLRHQKLSRTMVHIVKDETTRPPCFRLHVTARFKSLVRFRRKYPLLYPVTQHNDELTFVPGEVRILVIQDEKEKGEWMRFEIGAEVEDGDETPVCGANADDQVNGSNKRKRQQQRSSISHSHHSVSEEKPFNKSRPMPKTTTATMTVATTTTTPMKNVTPKVITVTKTTRVP
jgi:hypothetical protein